MRIALITEGTYPLTHGGVSVWCDHLIRNLPEVEFNLYAIAATAPRESVWALPENVVAFRTIGLESLDPRRFTRYPRACRSQFLEGFDALISETLRAPGAGEADFLQGLRATWEAGHTIPIDVGVRSAEAFDLINSRWRGRKWQGRSIGDRLDQLGPPSLLDVLGVSSSLARFLIPLRVTPEGEVAHTTANGLGALVALAGQWQSDMPTVLTEHGVYLRERYLERHQASVPKRVRAVELMFFRHLHGAMLQAADVVAPVSDFNRRWELHTGGPRRPIHTIHNGVNPESFPPQTEEPDVPTISWVGRVDPLKDLVTLIDAFALVRRSLPTARLRLFGPIPDGNESYHQECLQRIARHGLGDAVSFEGRSDRVSDAHRAAHVVALSSISEGFPFTVLEAMMSGRATVSTDVGGVREAVGTTGLLVSPRDPDALAGALVRVLIDHRLRQRLGKAARQRALLMFTLDRMTGLYRTVYQSACSHDLAVPLPPPAGSQPQTNVDVVEVSQGAIAAVGGRS
jgi:glycosyltransferase involved in cell wall biosynthesis